MKPARQLQALLSERRLKKTTQRTLVWNAIRNSKGHPSADEICERLASEGHRVGLATVYRTLKLLLDSGLIRQARDKGTTRYEPLVGDPNHIHFICSRCGSTREYASRKLERLILEVTRRENFEERFSRYSIFGMCQSCAAKIRAMDTLTGEERLKRALIRDALELTLAIERRGYSFYTRAAQKTKNPRGRAMFGRLAEEEAEHLDRLQKEYRALIEQNDWLRREPARLPLTRRIASRIFPERELMRADVTERTTDRDALDIAVRLERRSHEFFSDFASTLPEADGRDFFRQFAREEESHLATLMAEYDNL